MVVLGYNWSYCGKSLEVGEWILCQALKQEVGEKAVASSSGSWWGSGRIGMVKNERNDQSQEILCR